MARPLPPPPLSMAWLLVEEIFLRLPFCRPYIHFELQEINQMCSECGVHTKSYLFFFMSEGSRKKSYIFHRNSFMSRSLHVIKKFLLGDLKTPYSSIYRTTLHNSPAGGAKIQR